MNTKIYNNKLLVLIAFGVLAIYPIFSFPQSQQIATEDQDNVPHNHGVMYKCDCASQKMIIRDENVTLSRLVNDKAELWCKCARKLEIFALNSVKIDCNLRSGAEGLSVTIIARNWILSGKRLIDLSGWRGDTLEKARDGKDMHPNGKDGAAGKPGKNGGIFYGVYESLDKNPLTSTLAINVSGGDGGDGQEGGDGKTGVAGENGKREDFPSPYSELDSKMTRLRQLELNVIYAYRYKNYIIYGTEGQPGGNGGDGGVAGLGGHPGLVSIRQATSGTSNHPENWYTVKSQMGEDGNDGDGGKGGQGGKHGDGYQCTWRGVLADSIRWWDKCHFVPVSPIASLLFAPTGELGRTGGNSKHRSNPSLPNYDSGWFTICRQKFKYFVSFESKDLDAFKFAAAVRMMNGHHH